LLWGPQDYAMRAWIRTDRLTGLGRVDEFGSDEIFGIPRLNQA
jgi:hypothetical protein